MTKRKPRDPTRSIDLPHQWVERHIERLSAFAIRDSIDIDGWQRRRASFGRDGYELVDRDWVGVRVGELWGDPQSSTEFFRTTLAVPSQFDGCELHLDIDMDGGETLVTVNGVRRQGLDRFRSLVPLGPRSADEKITVELEAFIINYPYDHRAGDERATHQFKRARLLRFDKPIVDCVADLRFVLDAYLDLWTGDVDLELESYLLHHLEAACRELGPSLSSSDESRGAAERAAKLLNGTVFSGTAYRRHGSICTVANSHLDLAYLWPVHETERKGARTTANMLSLLDEFDDFRFTQSQLWLYESLERSFPDLFKAVCRRVTEGRWEVTGAMYVEPDANLISGESFVRQLLFGKTYARERLGVDPKVAWFPDVFGAVHTLPQILRQAGVSYFLTPKLQIFNDTNDQPHDSFRWRGPDGSEVIAHCPPTHFAQSLGYGELRRHRAAQSDKWTAPETLFLYGWGDGGGGPTREMIEVGQRARDFPGLPVIESSLAEEFFDRLAQGSEELPVWDDELYLEEHRGTYTTKGELKGANRAAELLYRDAEIVSVLASCVGGPWVQNQLNEGWKLLLFNQFHDVLPGSHIPEVTTDALADYERVFAIGRQVRDESLETIASVSAPSGDVLVVNTLGWERADLVELPIDDASRFRLGEHESAVQAFGGCRYAFAAAVPALGWAVGRSSGHLAESDEAVATYDGNIIETALYRIELGSEGELARIFDKELDREVLAGPGNVFQLFEDDPGERFSAWDITDRLETYQYPVTQTRPYSVVSQGPLFAVFTAAWSCLGSTIEQELWLYRDSRRIDFKTRIDWRDSNKLLKVAFPLAVRTRQATYDTAFGTIERPTHRNTSWDEAKYEVCAHKWADLSQDDFGVALLNDGKYGHDARENVLRLSLLRSPTYPDPESDIGIHEFTYALLPHRGTWRDAQVDRRAYEMNVPLLSVAGRAESRASRGRFSMLSTDSDSVIIDTVKQAEDGRGIVMRCFDSHGRAEKIRFRTEATLANAAAANVLEEVEHVVPLEDAHSFTLQTRPYGIFTTRQDIETAEELNS